MDGHAPVATDSEARPVRLDPPKLAEQFAVRVAALALSTLSLVRVCDALRRLRSRLRASQP
jgi:hypothetical protein